MSNNRPKMCPRCGKLMGIDRICPYCGFDSKSKIAALRTRASRPQQDANKATLVFVAVNLFFYVLALLLGGVESDSSGMMDFLSPDRTVLLHLGLQHPALVDAGEWWRLIMPIFLHLSFLHVAMNTFILWVTGRMLERSIGSSAFVTLYLLAGIMGFVASQWAELGGGGASGSVAGILGGMISYRFLSDRNLKHPYAKMALELVVLNAIFGLMVDNVNNVAHLGGLVTGALLGAAYWKFEGQNFFQIIWKSTAFLTSALAVLALGMTLAHRPPAWQDELQKAITCYENSFESIQLERGRVHREGLKEAQACFEKVAPLNPEGTAIIEAIKESMAKVNQELDAGGQLPSDSPLIKNLLAFKYWVEAHPYFLVPR